MASKFIALFALVAVASAQHYHNDYYNSNYDNHHYAAPAVIKQIQPAIIKQVQPAIVKQVVHEAPANYEFNYDVHDPHTGDIKQQHEVAKDGHVSGEYSLIDSDGYRRVVSYTADDHQGFVAHVRREPVEGHKIIAQPAVHKVVAQPAIAVQKYVAPAQVYAAPAVHKYVAQPQTYAAPAVQKYVAPAQVYAAPAVQKYVAPAQVYAAPAVQKYIAQPQVYAAPAVHKYVAPAPVVEKYVAPVVKTIQPVAVNAVKYSSADSSAHVAVNGPHYNYHY